MESVETADVDVSLPVDEIRSTLEAHPVRLAILFGSRARGDPHARSDVDVAVELDGLQPGDEAFNDAFFGLGADLSETLQTDDVDVVDVHTLSPPLTRSVFQYGVLLFGSERRAEELRTEIAAPDADERSPGDRLDEALRRIDEHLA